MNEPDLLIDHCSLSVTDLVAAKTFYQRALQPLGMAVIAEFADETGVPVCGFGTGRKGAFWLAQDGPQTPPAHIAFRAVSRAGVRTFYAAALAAGGTCNGPPGIRQLYHPAYYAAFVLDPEGHNIEAVTFEPESVVGSEQ